MLKTYHGYYKGGSVVVSEGTTVEGGLAEQIHGRQPTWCEVIKEDQKTEKEPEDQKEEVKPVWNKPPADKMLTSEKKEIRLKSLEDMTRAELLDEAREAGVTGFHKMNKAQLIEAIEEV